MCDETGRPTFRVIARLDVKPPNLVKGIHLEGLRRLGTPGEFAKRYFEEGVDEISYQDVVASLYGRNGITSLVTTTAGSVFIPLTVGGGIRTLDDAVSLVRAGADKISLNTAAIRSPQIVSDVSQILGKQAVVVCIEATRRNGSWLAMTDGGREHTGRNAVDWAKEAESSGAGEIFVTSIDQDGTDRGPDLDLLSEIRCAVRVPVVLHGGVANPNDAVAAWRQGADGVAIASALHYRRRTVREFKTALLSSGAGVRP